MEIFQPGLLFMAQDQAAAAGGSCPAGLRAPKDLFPVHGNF